MRAIAAMCAISPSTLSKLISTDRRIDEKTLRKLCDRKNKFEGSLHVLLAHLRDEIDRAGRSQLEVKITSQVMDADDDIALLESHSRDDIELKAIIHDLAQLVRSIQRKSNNYPEINYDDRKVAED